MKTSRIKLNSETEIPTIGFGTWQLSPEDAYTSVEAALKTGYRVIDTAKIYGNEEAVGQAIKDSNIPRGQVFLTTKLWNSDQGYDSALRAFDKSLERLGLDYVDLYLIHWPGDNHQKRHDSWRALIEIQRQGRTKHIGVSNFTVKHLEDLFKEFDKKPSVNQVEFHPFIYHEQAKLLEFCKKQDILLEAYSPLARGRRSDPLLSQIGQKYGKSSSQVMLRWATQHGTLPLPRSSKASHVKENFEIFDFKLGPADMKGIDSISQTGRTAWDPTNLP